MFKRKNKDSEDRPQICRFCEKATLLDGGNQALCKHRGIVSPEHKCRKFSYDPLKRVPMVQPQRPQYTEEDLLL